MRLTVFTDYGLRILMVLASKRDGLVTIADIAASFGISDAHLMKVTHALGRTGWIETLRGRGGGLRLKADPTRLSLRRIVQTLESDFELVDCFAAANRCVLTGGCGAQVAFGRALKAYFDELERYSLADLVSKSAVLKQLPVAARA